MDWFLLSPTNKGQFQIIPLIAWKVREVTNRTDLFNAMKKDSITTFLIAAVCFIAMGVLMAGSFIFDDSDVKAAKAWTK
jgi:hypothetical protein